MNKSQKTYLIMILISGIVIILCSIFWDIIFLLAFIPSILTGFGMIIERKIKTHKLKSE